MIIIRNKLTNSVWIYRRFDGKMYVSFDFATNRPEDGYTHQHSDAINYQSIRDGLVAGEEIIYDSGEE